MKKKPLASGDHRVEGTALETIPGKTLLANDIVNRMKIRLLSDLAEQDATPSA